MALFSNQSLFGEGEMEIEFSSSAKFYLGVSSLTKAAKEMDQSAVLMEETGQVLKTDEGYSVETVVALTIVCFCLLLLGIVIICAFCRRR